MTKMDRMSVGFVGVGRKRQGTEPPIIIRNERPAMTRRERDEILRREIVLRERLKREALPWHKGWLSWSIWTADFWEAPSFLERSREDVCCALVAYSATFAMCLWMAFYFVGQFKDGMQWVHGHNPMADAVETSSRHARH